MVTRLCMFSAITGQGRYLLTPNFVHRKMKLSRIPLPKIAIQEYLVRRYVHVVEINVRLIGCLHYVAVQLRGLNK